MSRVVFVDVESSGLDPAVHEIIQLAAIVTDGDKEVESFEVKLKFDETKADPEALKLNHYDAEVWALGAWPPAVALAKFTSLLERHRTVEMVSAKSGKPYRVARLAAYNAPFDMEFIRRLFGDRFMPASYQALDVLQLALWKFHDAEPRPKDFKLTTVAEFLGINVDGAHDALADARLAWRVAEALK